MKTEKDVIFLISDAIASGKRSAVIRGEYAISGTIRLPSDFTLILSDAVLRMTDGSMAPTFMNEGARSDGTNDGTRPDRNIRLIGIGRAVIDGGNPNGLNETTSRRDGFPAVWHNNTILFANVDGFEIRGLQIRNQRWWAINLLFCRHGTVRDIEFSACCLRKNPDGTLARGLTHDNYGSVLVKNADGVDLRTGCHDILIENLSGFCEDDTVALTNLSGALERDFHTSGVSRDIHGVIVRNVRGSSYCSFVRLLCQTDARLYGILVDGVFDGTADTDEADRAEGGVRLGDTRQYGDVPSTRDSVFGIVIRNVFCRGSYCVALRGETGEVLCDGIFPFGDCRVAVADERPNGKEL